MFTGLIEEVGVVDEIRRSRGSVMMTIRAAKSVRGLKVDESVAVNGVCLTVVRSTRNSFTVQAVEETLRKTNLGLLQTGHDVNLERPLLPGERLGGHFVLGHVDCVGKVVLINRRKSSWMFWFKLPHKFARYVVPVGSVAINGVSLTVASIRGDEFAVSIIPHTWEVTTFRKLQKKDLVNVEFDVLGKYVERLLSSRRG